MVKILAPAFLFPGQGAQYPRMALDLLETGNAGVEELFALASDLMGQDMGAFLADSGEEKLRRTDIAQPVVILANLAAAAFLQSRGILPRAVAGFSLGEYAALAAAGIIDRADCFALVKARGKAMQDSADRITRESGDAAPGMAAVIGLDPHRVEELTAQWAAEGLAGLYCANFNSPRQVVISGTAPALAVAAERFRKAGAKRLVRLSVAGPFHSPLIADAAEAFRPVLESVRFRDPRIPFYSNVSGGPVNSGEEAKCLALRQITSPVRWTAEEAAIAAAGVDGLLETGPGRVLQGLWKDSGLPLPCCGAGTVADIETLAGS
ncbi:MAG: ACP S-malonyltransferase [Spirochaetaceae bacterium]|jgi:[acyl-carrier-protein] S-malonyltransferase|nr:ACP S-malonyltransferase [Spirochaetaceae bacterium]